MKKSNSMRDAINGLAFILGVALAAAVLFYNIGDKQSTYHFKLVKVENHA